jgi:hypothetical protein
MRHKAIQNQAPEETPISSGISNAFGAKSEWHDDVVHARGDSVDNKGEAHVLIDGFNLESLRLPQNFGETLGVRRLITRVPVRKPIKQEFFRVRPGEAWRFQAMILELKEESETYLLSSSLWSVMPELLRPAVLHTAADRRNNVFLIPVPLPGTDGRRNSWHESLAEVVEKAETRWVRSVANKAVGGYDMLVAEGNLAEPEWPDITFDELIKIAFRDRVITTEDHPVIRQLLGIS